MFTIPKKVELAHTQALKYVYSMHVHVCVCVFVCILCPVHCTTIINLTTRLQTRRRYDALQQCARRLSVSAALRHNIMLQCGTGTRTRQTHALVPVSNDIRSALRRFTCLRYILYQKNVSVVNMKAIEFCFLYTTYMIKR